MQAADFVDSSLADRVEDSWENPRDGKPQALFGRPCSPSGLFYEAAFQQLDLAGKAVVMYCLQCDQDGELGIQKFNTSAAARLLGLSVEETETALRQVVDAFDWRWDEYAGVLWMTDFHRRGKRWTPAAVRRGLLRAASLPDSPVLDAFFRHGVPPHQNLDAVWYSVVSPWRRPGDPPLPDPPPEPVSDSPAISESSAPSRRPSSPSSAPAPNAFDASPSPSNPHKPPASSHSHPSTSPNRRHSHPKPRPKSKRKRGR